MEKAHFSSHYYALLTLLRLVEPALNENLNVEDYEAPVKVDGIDVLLVGLRDLRSRLTRLLLASSGTIRDSVDPYQTYSDEQISRLNNFRLSEMMNRMA